MANATGAQIKSIKEGYDSLHIKNVKEADKENSIEQAKFDLKMTLWANINALGGLSALFKRYRSSKSSISRNSNRFCNRFNKWFRYSTKICKGTGPAAAFAFPIFYATQVAAVLVQ
jgi:hypothetical protein